MNNMHKERGGIVSFVVVGLLLAGLLLGGLYWSKHQARLAYKGDDKPTTQTVTPTRDDESDKTPSTVNDATSTEESNPAPATSTTPARPTTNTPKPQPKTPSTVTTTGPSTVAETGTSDTAAITAVMGILAFAVTRFVQARRRVLSSALDK